MNNIALISELHYKAVRSSGAGGQNVNKVSSKVVLSFDLKSSHLSEETKALLEQNISNRLTTDLVLILNCDEDRSQLKTRRSLPSAFCKLLKLEVPKERKQSSKGVIRKRIKDKKNVSQVKQNRRKKKWNR
jgi:ribosome-associated protein